MTVKKLAVESCLELTSDHTPILITAFTHILGKPKKPSLYSKKTDWNCFRETLDEHITTMVPPETEIGTEEAVENITKIIQNAAWQATPDRNEQPNTEECPIIIKQTGRKTRGPQKMATNKSPTRQTTIQQNSERPETTITHSQK